MRNVMRRKFEECRKVQGISNVGGKSVENGKNVRYFCKQSSEEKQEEKIYIYI